jgi:hypothetical protein
VSELRNEYVDGESETKSPILKKGQRQEKMEEITEN